MAYLEPIDLMSGHPDPDWAGYRNTARKVVIDENGRQHEVEPEDEWRLGRRGLHTGHAGVAVQLDFDAFPAGGDQ